MPTFSKSSSDRLLTCHPDLQNLFREVIKFYDCSIICGTRTKEEQDLAYDTGKSKLKWPNSKHNSNPSRAIDVVPIPINWNPVKENMYRYYHFSGYVLAMADKLGIKLRCGIDFNQNKIFSDDSFVDSPHFELI